VEDRAFEKLAGVLYEERSRKRIGDFPLSERINGYWDLDRHGDRPGGVERHRPAHPAGLLQALGSGIWSATYRSLAAMSSASCTSFPNTPAGGSNVCPWRRTYLNDVRQEIERQRSLVQDQNDLTAGL